MTASAHDDDVAAEGGRHPRPEGRTPRVAAQTRGPRMNAAETIAAAIEKLERLKEGTTPGPWRVVDESLQGSRHDYDPMIDAGDFAASGERFVRPADAELIVTLHRTIEAQLTILRTTLNHYRGDLGIGTNRLVVDMARAILGGAS